MSEQQLIVFCPECKQETAVVTVEKSGSGFNSTFEMTEHWFYGTAKCPCGYIGDYGDSSL